MNYELDELQLKLKNNITVFCNGKAASWKTNTDHRLQEQIDLKMKNSIKELSATGYLGLFHDKKYGGGNYNLETFVVAGEELSKAYASVFLSAHTSSMLFGMPVKVFGTEEQKMKYLPGIIKGDSIGCYAITEEESGSDDSLIKTTAKKKNGKWVLNGKKIFVTNAPIADVCLVTACTDESGTDAGITCFIVSKNTPGFKIGKIMTALGCKDVPMSEVIFDNCEVTDKEILGDAGRGLVQLNSLNKFFRLNIAALSLGIGMACMERSLKYAQKRKVSGKPLFQYQEVAHKLADMMILTDLSRLIIIKAAWAGDNNDPEAETLAACAKLYASEGVSQISDMALQIHGGCGYLENSDVEKLFRDARLCEILGGTSEIQRMQIAGSVIAQYS